MKLAKLQIENFRHLGTGGKPFELDFTDPLGRVRDFTLLVGPNTSGKTTVLDAIAAALGASLEKPVLRSDFVLSPRTVVTPSALFAEVKCWLQFDEEEVQTARAIGDFGEPIAARSPLPQQAMLTWVYPDPHRQSDAGSVTWDSPGGRSLLKLRDHATFLLALGKVGWDWLRRAGGVFTFDQERTGFGKTVSRDVWNVIHGTAKAAEANKELRTADPRTILIDLALRSLVPRASSEQRPTDLYQIVRTRYQEVCGPRDISVVRDDLDEINIRFRNGNHEYGYDGLSSGEKMVLLMLIRFVSEHIHRSVVLIDELELNQHPTWQRRLLYLLPRMGEHNQIIATTHSPYLRDAVPAHAVVELGGLGDARTAGGD